MNHMHTASVASAATTQELMTTSATTIKNFSVESIACITIVWWWCGEPMHMRMSDVDEGVRAVYDDSVMVEYEHMHA